MNWMAFFKISSKILYDNINYDDGPECWCSWTTFERLQRDSGYWTSPFPIENDITEWGIRDSGTWMQPFPFWDIAHVIIPSSFTYDDFEKGIFRKSKFQNIKHLSDQLNNIGIEHGINDYYLDVKSDRLQLSSSIKT
jgi:hypothetical protein